MKNLKDSVKILLTILLWGVVCVASAHELQFKNSYFSKELEAIAKKASVASICDTLSEGVHYHCTTYKNLPLTIIVEEGEVWHIGFSVFTTSQRRLMDSFICNFIERYALAQKLPMGRGRTNEELMQQDYVMFRKGSFDTMKQIMADSTLTINISKISNLNVISWSKNGNLLCELGFPSSYKLLLGMEMDELDGKLKADILSTKTSLSDSLQEFKPEELVKSVTNDFFVKKGTNYYFAELNSDLYLQSVNDNQGNHSYQIMFNERYPHQSLANMMTTTALKNNLELQIKQEVYGGKDSLFLVPLTQFVTFCLKKGCKPYFCVISDTGSMMDCELIMCNETLQYNHVMRMNVNIDDVKCRSGVIKARLDAYIPTHYLKNLFNELK